MSVSLRVPIDLPLGSAPGRAVLGLIKDFLQSPTPRIVTPEPETGDLIRVPIPTRDLIALKRLSVTPEQAVWSQWQPDKTTDAPVPPPPIDTSTHGFRPEQKAYWRAIQSSLGARQDPIVAAEGSTGLGKGRVLAMLADDHADEGVLVAAPSMQVLGQLMQEFRSVSDRPVSFVLGRGQFVSVGQLELMVEGDEDLSDDDRQTIREWLAAGGPGHSPHTHIFHEINPAVRWLAEDLAYQLPDLALPTLSLADDDDDPAQQVYFSLRYTRDPDANSPDSPVPGVTFASHSALAWDARLRATEKGALLPPFGLLIIDEAHEFAGSVENTFSSSVAFRGLSFILRDEAFWRKHRRLGASRQAKARVNDVLAEFGGVTDLESDSSFKRLMEVRPAIRQRMQALRSALQPLAHRHPGVQTGLDAIEDALAGSTRTQVHFSSVMRHPSVVSGPKSLKFFFDSFWETTPKVVLASATLLLPNSVTRQGSPSYLMTTLHLPAERLTVPTPVTTRWLYDPDLTVIDPIRTDLVPPQESSFDDHDGFEAAKSDWHLAVAEEILSIHDTARGGVLVLLPGYEPISGIAEALADCGRALIEQTPGSYRSSRRRFMACEDATGKRPIWLATGPAWTGMDVKGDCPPSQDFLLTDLVVPRLPFGVDRSSVHLNRMRYIRAAERDRAAFQFRQGLGRLMRADGMRQRRIWLLDGRMHNKAQAWLMAPFWSICRKYGRHS